MQSIIIFLIIYFYLDLLDAQESPSSSVRFLRSTGPWIYLRFALMIFLGTGTSLSPTLTATLSTLRTEIKYFLTLSERADSKFAIADGLFFLR